MSPVTMSDAPAAGELVRRLRAGGVRSAFVLLVPERDDTLAQRVGGLGALEQVALGDAPRTIGAAIETAREQITLFSTSLPVRCVP